MWNKIDNIEFTKYGRFQIDNWNARKYWNIRKSSCSCFSYCCFVFPKKLRRADCGGPVLQALHTFLCKSRKLYTRKNSWFEWLRAVRFLVNKVQKRGNLMRIPQRMEHFDGRYKQVPLILTGKFTHIEYSYDFSRSIWNLFTCTHVYFNFQVLQFWLFLKNTLVQINSCCTRSRMITYTNLT